MKYIKKFEVFDSHINKKFPPNTYFIATKKKWMFMGGEHRYLFLAKVLNIKDVKTDCLYIKYIDSISDKDKDLLGDDVINIPSIGTIYYKSTNCIDAQERFDKMKKQKPYSDWFIEKDMKKYNL